MDVHIPQDLRAPNLL